VVSKNNFLDVGVQHQDEAAHITMTVLGYWHMAQMMRSVSPVSLQTGNKGLHLNWAVKRLKMIESKATTYFMVI